MEQRRKRDLKKLTLSLRTISRIKKKEWWRSTWDKKQVFKLVVLRCGGGIRGVGGADGVLLRYQGCWCWWCRWCPHCRRCCGGAAPIAVVTTIVMVVVVVPPLQLSPPQWGWWWSYPPLSPLLWWWWSCTHCPTAAITPCSGHGRGRTLAVPATMVVVVMHLCPLPSSHLWW